MKKKRPTLCIVAGPNGSGKTSATIQLLHNEWAAKYRKSHPIGRQGICVR